MLLMFERSIQGGITKVIHRYVKVNNKYMGGKFNCEEPSSFLQYLDANNLYGWAMSQLLPAGGFRWVDVSDISKLSKITKNDLILNSTPENRL